MPSIISLPSPKKSLPLALSMASCLAILAPACAQLVAPQPALCKTTESKEEEKARKDEEKAKKDEEKAKKDEEKAKKDDPELVEEERLYNEYQAQLQKSLKETKTPFTLGGPVQDQAETSGSSNLQAVTLGAGKKRPKSLQDRLLPPRLYLPSRMILGKPSQFTVKGKAGLWVAIAMANRNTGAKPVAGNDIRLGPDRKVIALGKIPDNQVLTLEAYTPISGDLLGGNLYFEAALWKDGDPTHAEIAQTIQVEPQEGSNNGNGVLVSAPAERKHGVRIVPNTVAPISVRNSQSGMTLDSGHP